MRIWRPLIFRGVYRAFKVLGWRIGQEEAFAGDRESHADNKILKVLAVIGFVALENCSLCWAIVMIVQAECLWASSSLSVSAVIATAAAMFEQVLQTAVDMKPGTT
jgi:hypothetical protein